MIQTTNIEGHTYYIVDARTITPCIMVAREINLMLNHCKKHGIPIIYVASVNQCIMQHERYIRYKYHKSINIRRIKCTWEYNHYLYYLHKNERIYVLNNVFDSS